MPHVLLIEAFYGGSHKQLMDLLASAHNATLCTLPSKKWHWRARTAALYFSQTVPRDPEYSSVLNLAELVALRPDLAGLKKVLYFHENQLVYPVRKQQDRDFQYGYNQVLSSLVADQILFNSHFNMDSFLSHIPGFLKQMPDFRPKGLPQQIGLKCGVLYFPLAMSEVTAETHNRLNEGNTVKGLGEQSAEMKECVQGNMFIERNSADDVMEHCTETTVQGLDGKCTESTVQGLDGNCTEAAACVQQVSSQMCAHRVNSNQCNQTESSLECNQQLHSEDGSQQVHLQECDNQMYSQACSKTVHCTAEGFVGNGEELSVRKKPRTGVLHIVWPHRWEHDKNPDLFFKTLLQLKSEGLDFRLSVLGESYTDVPEVFSEAQKNLSDEIVHWGFVASKADYYGVLREADVVVSTANHEFYGVAMLEAALCGCFPVCPNKLVYPEIFQHEDCLYNTENQLLKKLRTFCKKPHLVRQKTLGLNVKRFSWDVLQSKFAEVLDV